MSIWLQLNRKEHIAKICDENAYEYYKSFSISLLLFTLPK